MASTTSGCVSRCSPCSSSPSSASSSRTASPCSTTVTPRSPDCSADRSPEAPYFTAGRARAWCQACPAKRDREQGLRAERGVDQLVRGDGVLAALRLAERVVVDLRRDGVDEVPLQ